MYKDFAAAEEEEEEELEWLSNKDTFPSVESCFGILSDNPQLVSVLHNTNALVVPTNFPTRARRSRLGRKRRLDYSKLFENNPETSASFQLPTTRRRCLHCQVDTTPQWRAGPLGPKTLCNACGVRFKSGRLLPEYRPACSPTFSSTLHSNSHRKVVEMRKQKHVSTGGGGEF